jgi:HPP family protein/type III secretion system (T3SS) inner membrane Yop/YscD-like protein
MTMHADRASPAPHRGGPRPQAGPASGPGFAAAVDPRPVLAGTLHVLDGPDRGKAWRLSPGTYLLGRAPNCNLPITDPEVSRWHCVVAVAGQAPGRPATVTVEDRGSNTGTVVDGVPAGRPSVLTPGARIVVGRTTLGWAPAGWNPAASPAPVPGTPMAAPAAPPIRPRHNIPVPPAAPAPPRAQTPEEATVRLAVAPTPAHAAPVLAPGATTGSTPQPRQKRWPPSAAPARPTPRSTLLATLTILVALATLAIAGAVTHLPLLFPPLAASMALIAAGTALPLAQPRNVLGGHVVSALVGFTAVALIGSGGWAAALAGACALGAMLVLRISHSPAVATAVIVGATAPSVPQFMELLVLAGVILVAFGMVGARLDGKKYPVYWW